MNQLFGLQHRGGQTPCEVKTPYPSSPAQQGNTPCAGGFPCMSLDDNQGNRDNLLRHR